MYHPRNSRHSLCAGATIAVLALGLSMPAEAKKVDLRADVYLHTQSGITAAVPIARVGVPLGALTLRADFGVLVADIAELVRVKPLNPFVGVGYDLKLGAMNFSIAAGLAIPILRFSEAGEPPAVIADAAAVGAAAAMVGYWDPWLYQTDTLSVAFPARLELGVPGIDAMVEGALYVFLDTGAASNEFGLQVAAEAALPLLPVLSLGARLQAVYLITQDGLFQTAVEPFVQANLGPFSLRGGLLMNLDEPGGFAFSENGFWSAHVGLRMAI